MTATEKKKKIAELQGQLKELEELKEEVKEEEKVEKAEVGVAAREAKDRVTVASEESVGSLIQAINRLHDKLEKIYATPAEGETKQKAARFF